MNKFSLSPLPLDKKFDFIIITIKSPSISLTSSLIFNINREKNDNETASNTQRSTTINSIIGRISIIK